MSATELHIEVETEHQRVERWRVEELERAGYDPGAAVRAGCRPPRSTFIGRST